MSLLDLIISGQTGRPNVVSTNHDVNSINWVAGMSDPGEMIGCGMYQQLRRHAGEQDAAYQTRITAELEKLPTDIRERIKSAGKNAATKRASLNVTNGKVSLMTAGALPWHGLGVNVASAVTSADAIKLASMDWTVSKRPLTYDHNGNPMQAEGAFGIVRDDNGAFLGMVGSRYKPLQNEHGFDFLDSVLQDFGARYESAGALYDGQSVFMVANLPRQSFRVNGDEIDAYAMFANYHDGSGAAACFPTSTRAVCANTFTTAMRDKRKGLSIRHTGDIKGKIDDAKKALGIAVQSFEEFKQGAETLYAKKMEFLPYANEVLDACLDITQAQMSMGANVLAAAIEKTKANQDLLAVKIDKQIERRKEILADILDRYESRTNGVSGMRGTAWSGFNAVTEHADHNKIGRHSQDAKVRASRRFESVIGGEADVIKQTAYEIALKA